MRWVFIGYMAAFVAALFVHAAFTIGSHPKPMQGLLAYFVLIPMLIAAFSAEGVWLAPDRWKKTMESAFERGVFSRRYAFYAGAVTGMVVLFCGAAAYFFYGFIFSGAVGFLKTHEETIFKGGALVLLFVLALAPAVPIAWLVRKAERRVDSK